MPDNDMPVNILQRTPREHVRLQTMFIGTPTLVPECLSRDKEKASNLESSFHFLRLPLPRYPARARHRINDFIP
jgi:hypothetical protein